MSQIITAQTGPTITIEEAVAGALDNKEDLLIALNSSGKAILFDGTSPAIGVMTGKLQPGSTAITVRLLNGAGTARMIQNAAIVPGVRVAGVNANARVATAATTNRAVGIKVSPGNGAAGDVIEVLTGVEYVP